MKTIIFCCVFLFLAFFSNYSSCESVKTIESNRHGVTAKNCDCWKGYTAAAATGIGALVGVPLVIGALGFGPLGIVAGSYAAGMMSTAATTGVGAGLVAAGQAAGAAGLSVAAKGAVVAAGAALGYTASGGCDCEC